MAGLYGNDEFSTNLLKKKMGQRGIDQAVNSNVTTGKVGLANPALYGKLEGNTPQPVVGNRFAQMRQRRQAQAQQQAALQQAERQRAIRPPAPVEAPVAQVQPMPLPGPTPLPGRIPGPYIPGPNLPGPTPIPGPSEPIPDYKTGLPGSLSIPLPGSQQIPNGLPSPPRRGFPTRSPYADLMDEGLPESYRRRY